MRSMTIGQLLDVSLDPARRLVARTVARMRLRAAQRDLELTERQIRECYEAQKYLHQHIGQLQSFLRSR